MYTNYDENDLDNLFKSKPINIYEKEAGMFIYSYTDNNEIKITVNVSIYEKECLLYLSKNEIIMLETKLKNVNDLISEDGCLRIHRNDAISDIIVQFIPNILVKYEDN